MNYKHSLLITEKEIERRIADLAATLNKDYANQMLDMICVLKGAIFFASDLTRNLNLPLRFHFIQTSSYNDGTETSGTVRLHYSSIPKGLAGCHVLVVEDIMDTGITMDYLLRHLGEQRPLSLKTCVLLDKRSRRRVPVKPDYVGFEISDDYVIGYGLDFREFGRNLKYIAVLDRSEYQK